MNAANLRRQDTTKGPPLRILSLDGGGVRGYSMLILLQELMHRTHVEIYGQAPRPQEIPKPCDHFDLIAGTGTGGLIAIMLGRLRLDLETCKDVYIRMTKRVFETDKTFAGIPYRSTLFKASKLEEAIRDCVREHTIFEDEGNDTLASATPMTLDTPRSAATGPPSAAPSRSMSTTSRMSMGSPSPYSPSLSGRPGASGGRWGNPNALLYDVRENRTKTAVTATYKGARTGDKAVLLRSYDSRREPAPEFNCAIWQAGRATSATGLAFKPIQIGQSIFIDEGAGRYNCSPQILDEAVMNEYPTRDIGVFVSIGTGKRPPGTNQQQSDWWEGFLGGSMGDFAEARRRLISKIEGCEETHQYMIHEHLGRRGVNPECYYRLNVEVGVGEFGMNEWSRLSDISTNTRRYLSKEDVQNMNLSAATKIGRIHRAKVRWERANGISPPSSRPYSFDEQRENDSSIPSDPMVVELPAEVPADYAQAQPHYPQHQQQSYPPQNYPQQQHQQPQPPNPTFAHQVHRPSYDDKIPIDVQRIPSQSQPQEQPQSQPQQPQQHFQQAKPPSQSQNPDDRIPPQNYAPLPNSSRPMQPHRQNSPPVGQPHSTAFSHPQSQHQPQQQHSQPSQSTPYPSSPPPLPPKTPIGGHRDRDRDRDQYLQRPPDSGYSVSPLGPSPRVSGEQVDRYDSRGYSGRGGASGGYQEPYPDRDRNMDIDPDAPPPVVDMRSKPTFGVRYGGR